jgi:hypothetical protein
VVVILGVVLLVYIRKRVREDNIALSSANFAYNNPTYGADQPAAFSSLSL